MNCETKNVIQVESDSDGIVASTKSVRTQPQIPTLSVAQLFLKVCAQLVCLMAVLISFITALIGNLFRLVNNSKLSIMSRLCGLVAVAFIWSVIFTMNSTGFAQTPGVTIAANTGMQTATIKEGEEISVIIQRTASASTPLDVTIKIEEITSDTSPANILEDSLESSATTATIPANATNLTYAISSQQDTSSTNGGTVVITLIASTADPITYSIPSQDSEKKVTFTVSHYEPTISIHPAGTTDQIKTIMEGEAMSVDVKRSTAAAFDLDVTIMISETPRSGTPPPNILENSLEGSIVLTIPASKLSFTYTIDSQQDSANGAGEAVFTLVNEDTYAIPTAAENQKVTFTVTHFGGPIATIELANTDLVTAGSAAEFVVTISKAQSSNFTVVVTISGDTDYISGSAGDRNVVIPSGMLSKTHSEATTDTMNNTFGTINATIKTGSNYVFGSTKRRATVYVNDSNVPQIVITTYSLAETNTRRGRSTGRIISGQTAQILASAPNPQLVTDNLNVRYRIQENSPPGIDILENGREGKNTFVFNEYDATNNPEARTTISFPTITHNSNISGLIEFQLQNGPGYGLVRTGSTGSVQIIVYKKPTVSIIPINHSITSNSPARFEVSIFPVPPFINETFWGFNVNFEKFVDANKVAGITTQIIREINGIHTFEISNSATSSVELRIKPDNSYSIGSSDRTTVSVGNTALPEISISTPNTTLNETAGSINFTLTASATPVRISAVGIMVNISETEDFLASNLKRDHLISLPASSSEATLNIPIENDQINEASGIVNAVILANTEYTVPSPTAINKRRVSVEIEDDDQPTLSIESVTGHVIEGAPAKFKIIASPTPQVGFAITYTLSSSGNSTIIDISTEILGNDKIIIFPSNQSELEISVNTEQDKTAEDIAAIRILIQESSNYKIGTKSQADIHVLDDDVATRIAVISAPSTPFSEGDTVEFSVSVVPPPTSNLTVSISYNQISDDSVFLQTSSDSVNLTSSKSTGSISKQIEKDGLYGTDGALYASIVADASNFTKITQSRAEVNYADADSIPTIAIAPRTGEFNESNDNSFTLNLTSTTSKPATNTTIFIEVDDGDNNYFAQDLPFEQTVTLNANTTSAPLVITPENDFKHDPEGTFTVTVIPPKTGTPMNYQPAAAPLNVATITYMDDDFENLPILSISAPPEDVMEADGAEAVFTIASEETLPQGLTSLTVQTIITDSGDYISDSESITLGMQVERQISFTGSEAELRIAIDNDAVSWRILVK